MNKTTSTTITCINISVTPYLSHQICHTRSVTPDLSHHISHTITNTISVTPYITTVLPDFCVLQFQMKLPLIPTDGYSLEDRLHCTLGFHICTRKFSSPIPLVRAQSVAQAMTRGDVRRTAPVNQTL